MPMKMRGDRPAGREAAGLRPVAEDRWNRGQARSHNEKSRVQTIQPTPVNLRKEEGWKEERNRHCAGNRPFLIPHSSFLGLIISSRRSQLHPVVNTGLDRTEQDSTPRIRQADRGVRIQALRVVL